MINLTAFLYARLEEDEAIARAAADSVEEAPGFWRYDEGARPVPRIIGTSWESSLTDGVWNCDDPDDHCDELRHPSRSAGKHIARHDPARVLRDVTADRKLLTALERATEYSDRMFGPVPPDDIAHGEWPGERMRAATQVLILEYVARIRAERFSDHPGYWPGWAPDANAV